MKKITKEKLVELLKEGKHTYKELSSISGYHVKSINRINSQIKSNTVRIEHGNKNRKPHNFINESKKKQIILFYKNGDYKNQLDYYNHLSKYKIDYSYSFVNKLLKANLPKEKKVTSKKK